MWVLGRRLGTCKGFVLTPQPWVRPRKDKDIAELPACSQLQTVAVKALDVWLVGGGWPSFPLGLCPPARAHSQLQHTSSSQGPHLLLDQEDCTFAGSCGQTGVPRRPLLVGLGPLAPRLSIWVTLSTGHMMATSNQGSLQATLSPSLPKGGRSQRTSLTPRVRPCSLLIGSPGPSAVMMTHGQTQRGTCPS